LGVDVVAMIAVLAFGLACGSCGGTTAGTGATGTLRSTETTEAPPTAPSNVTTTSLVPYRGDVLKDRVAMSDLRNAFTAEKVIWTDNLTYTDTLSPGNRAQLAAVEPALTWVVPAPRYARQNIGVTVPRRGEVIIADQSATGVCFYIVGIDSATNSATYFASSRATPCAQPAMPVAAPTLAHVDGSGTWALAF
jgi:hypothetical protein